VRVVVRRGTAFPFGTRERNVSIPWREVIGMRNRLVHGYASVDHDVIWDVVTADLP